MWPCALDFMKGNESTTLEARGQTLMRDREMAVEILYKLWFKLQ